MHSRGGISTVVIDLHEVFPFDGEAQVDPFHRTGIAESVLRPASPRSGKIAAFHDDPDKQASTSAGAEAQARHAISRRRQAASRLVVVILFVVVFIVVIGLPCVTRGVALVVPELAVDAALGEQFRMRAALDGAAA